MTCEQDGLIVGHVKRRAKENGGYDFADSPGGFSFFRVPVDVTASDQSAGFGSGRNSSSQKPG
jgi:hypothetical protein